MRAVRAALRGYPLFALLPADWLDCWVTSGTECAVAAGETLFTAGSVGTHAYFVLAGRVRVLRQGQGGREIALGTHGPGEVFGEYALLAPGRNTATCRVADPGRVLCLPLGPLRDAVAPLLAGRSQLKDWLRLHFVLAHLRGRPSLGFMSGPSFLPLLEQLGSARFAAGETIQADGLHDDAWFVVQAGRAAVRSDRDEEFSRILVPGDSFGEPALLGRPVALVEAATDVACLRLLRSALPGDGTLAEQTISTVAKSVPPCRDWIAQLKPNDCGVAALAMAAHALGRRVTRDEVQARIRLDARGASLLELRQGARQLGLRAEAVRVGMEHLAAVRLPAIAHLDGGHYVTLFDIGPAGVEVGDPASGVAQWPLEQFRRCWLGSLLLVTVRTG